MFVIQFSTHVAGVDAQLAAIDALSAALNQRVQSVQEAKNMQASFTAMLARTKAMAVHKQKRLLHEIINERLREVVQHETEGSRMAVEYVVKTTNDIVVALFATNPALRKQVLSESIAALGQGSGAKLNNSLLLQVYQIAFQYMRYVVCACACALYVRVYVCVCVECSLFLRVSRLAFSLPLAPSLSLSLSFSPSLFSDTKWRSCVWVASNWTTRLVSLWPRMSPIKCVDRGARWSLAPSVMQCATTRATYSCLRLLATRPKQNQHPQKRKTKANVLFDSRHTFRAIEKKVTLRQCFLTP